MILLLKSTTNTFAQAESKICKEKMEGIEKTNAVLLKSIQSVSKRLQHIEQKNALLTKANQNIIQRMDALNNELHRQKDKKKELRERIAKLEAPKEHAYFFYGATATPSHVVAEIVIKENYAAFCQAIGKIYTRHTLLNRHYNARATNGAYYLNWYYTGFRFGVDDTHYHAIPPNQSPNEGVPYNAWQYRGKDNKGKPTCCPQPSSEGLANVSLRASAIIYCK